MTATGQDLMAADNRSLRRRVSTQRLRTHQILRGSALSHPARS